MYLTWNGEVDLKNLDTIMKGCFNWLETPPEQRSEIHLWISGPGGEAGVAFGFYDFINYYNIPLTTIAFGDVCSANMLIFAAGTHRIAVPSARFMFHQPQIGITESHQFSRDEMLDLVQQNRAWGAQIGRFIARVCNKPLSEIRKLLSKETYLSATEARQLGLVHKVKRFHTTN